jgi:hypothetical protein
MSRSSGGYVMLCQFCRPYHLGHVLPEGLSVEERSTSVDGYMEGCWVSHSKLRRISNWLRPFGTSRTGAGAHLHGGVQIKTLLRARPERRCIVQLVVAAGVTAYERKRAALLCRDRDCPAWKATSKVALGGISSRQKGHIATVVIDDV